MLEWLQDLRQALDSAPCEQTLFQATCGFAEHLGFQYCSYYMRAPLPASAPATGMLTNHAAWHADYQRNNYLAVDPTLKHASRCLHPLVWSEKLFACAPDLWNNLQENGLKVGWAHPARDARNVVGLLTLARCADELQANEMQSKLLQFTWLAQVTHLGISSHLARKFVPTMDVTLSTRETDVLRWTAEGKTSREISEILHITDRTVNFHINNAVAKLRVSNKTAAAVHAALLGLL